MWLIPLEQAMFSRRIRGSVGRKNANKRGYSFASAVAAMKCTQPGGRAGIPIVSKPNHFCHFMRKMVNIYREGQGSIHEYHRSDR